MKDIIILIMVYISLASPTVAEALVIDPWLWLKHGTDKPLSTWMRGGLFLLVSLGTDFIANYCHWYLALFVTVTFHIAAFAPLINWKLCKKISYLGSDRFDLWLKQFPFWLRFGVAVILFIVSVVLFEVYKY